MLGLNICFRNGMYGLLLLRADVRCTSKCCLRGGCCRSQLGSHRSQQGVAGHSALPPGRQPGSSSPGAAHARSGARCGRQPSASRPCRPLSPDRARSLRPRVQRSVKPPKTLSRYTQTHGTESLSIVLHDLAGQNSTALASTCKYLNLYGSLNIWQMPVTAILQDIKSCLCCFAESHAAVASATQQSTAAALLLKGLPWNRAAAPGLAAASALTHLSCHGNASSQERSLAFAQVAQHAAEHKGYRAAEQVSLSATLYIHPCF